MIGFVDVGTGSLGGDVAEATDAIVIMALGLQSHWRIPVGYFMIYCIDGWID